MTTSSSASRTTDTAEGGNYISLVTVKLPLFWAENPLMKIPKVEAQFCLKNITRSSTQFDHVLARLPQEVTVLVKDMVSAATNPFSPSLTPLTP